MLQCQNCTRFFDESRIEKTGSNTAFCPYCGSNMSIDKYRSASHPPPSVHTKEHRTHTVVSSVRRAAGETIEARIAKIIQYEYGKCTRPVVIAIGGPGGTGKTTFAERLAQQLGTSETAILHLDDYKESRAKRQEAQVYGPHPRANKMSKVTSDLCSIRANTPFDQPLYNGVEGTTDETKRFTPARWNIVEGEISTYSEFRAYIDFSIFIDASWHTQLSTRLGRDRTVRGFSLDKAIATFLHSNLREFVAHGAESKAWADVHLLRHDSCSLTLESLARELYERVKHLLNDTLDVVEAEGLIVPVLTPFTAENAVDHRAFVAHLDWLAERNVQRIIVGGTTGEFFSLKTEERIALVELARAYFPGLIWFQAGGGACADAVFMAEKAAQFGADGIVCLPPGYYANAPEKGLIDYFNAVQKAAADIPLILYNFTRHTQNTVTPEILRAVSHFGVKDADGTLELCADTPHYFIGSDALIIEGMRRGARGFVSAAANVFAQEYVALEQYLKAGADTDAQTLHTAVMAKKKWYGKPEIVALKTRIAKLLPGYPVTVRPPLVD